MEELSERTAATMQQLVRVSHTAGPDVLPTLTLQAASRLGADSARLYLVDYDQVLLVPLPPPEGLPEAEPLRVEGTLAGRAFTDMEAQTTSAPEGVVVWLPLLDGTDRLGVLQVIFPATVDVDAELVGSMTDVAGLLAQLTVTRSEYGDVLERIRRRAAMTLPAEMQWRLLPPLSFVAPGVAIAGILAPTTEVAGDSFDYALNGDVLHVAIIDAMGHGLEAALLATVAIAALRNARRDGQDLIDTAQFIDTALADQFGPDKFVTAIIGQLDTRTGWWRWITAGHPPGLLVRAGRVVKQLDDVVTVPLGLGLLPGEPAVGEQRLEPGDRLLLYTDGVVEARDSSGQFFTPERLTDFITRNSAATRAMPETLRRLNHAILAHQEGVLQDDATTVMVEWRTDQAERIQAGLDG